MNSEPHESAAWRTFGMLDADAAAAFDEAMRRDPELRNAYQEMDRLAAAVAVTTTTPIAPQAGQLERLHLRLGLNAAKRANWLGITGWAAAAVLTLVLVLDRTQDRTNRAAEQATFHPATRQPQSVATPPEQSLTIEDDRSLTRAPEEIVDRGLAATHQDGDARVIAKVETKRLIQEIEVLRGQLESVLERDRNRFESVPGMAWPIVVRMRPPETFTDAPSALALKLDDPAITSMLGDALTAANQPQPLADPFADRVIVPPVTPAPYVEPSAIPIYDSARDTGTLVVSNLPAPTADEAYNLWVTTKTGDKPVHVGRLPESNVRGGESFDFSLGSKATVPSGFILTKDRQGTPPLPSGGSTVLQGPR
jgi:hypothetical protein